MLDPSRYPALVTDRRVADNGIHLGKLVSRQLLYEHPLNERIRTFLRLEHLFGKAEHFAAGDDPWDTRSAIDALLDISEIAARVDIKNELLKELDRHASTLNRIRLQPNVHKNTLDRILSDLGKAVGGLQHVTGQIGQITRDDEFLKSVAQRRAIPGGSCSFDLPIYHRWLAQPGTVRRDRLSDWMADLEPAKAAIALVLSLTRTSAAPRAVTATMGFFQEALDSHAPAQMVRVGVNGDGRLYPEISGHKNRFSIRFMEVAVGTRPVQSQDDVEFHLTCCVF